MNRSLSTDNPIMNFLTIVCDIVILHFLWSLTSLPILTIGASTTALYYTTMKCIRNGQGGVVKLFFKSFRENFKQATGIGVLALLAGVLCAFDMWFAVSRNIKSMLVIFTIMSLIYLFTVLYVFPLQAQFENTVKATIKNAFLMSIKNLPWTLLMVAITARSRGMLFQLHRARSYAHMCRRTSRLSVLTGICTHLQRVHAGGGREERRGLPYS